MRSLWLVCQMCSTRDMIFSVGDLLSFVSQGTTLPAGTVILTGTPAVRALVGVFSATLTRNAARHRGWALLARRRCTCKQGTRWRCAWARAASCATPCVREAVARMHNTCTVMCLRMNHAAGLPRLRRAWHGGWMEHLRVASLHSVCMCVCVRWVPTAVHLTSMQSMLALRTLGAAGAPLHQSPAPPHPAAPSSPGRGGRK